MESVVAPKKFVDQAYAAILDAISNGTLKPDERLTQDGVAQRLNVSRQPIHNALLVLKAQGFVREAGRRGLSVAPLDPKLFDAIYQFRSAVEPLAVTLAVAYIDQRAAQEGRALIARGKAAAAGKDPKSLIAADMAFHSFIYELSGNSLIVETMRLNWHHLRRAMGQTLGLPGLARRVWKEHETIRLTRDHVVMAHRDVSIALRARG